MSEHGRIRWAMPGAIDVWTADGTPRELQPCSGDCYSCFEEGRNCTRHGRTPPSLNPTPAPAKSVVPSSSPTLNLRGSQQRETGDEGSGADS